MDIISLHFGLIDHYLDNSSGNSRATPVDLSLDLRVRDL